MCSSGHEVSHFISTEGVITFPSTHSFNVLQKSFCTTVAKCFDVIYLFIYMHEHHMCIFKVKPSISAVLEVLVESLTRDKVCGLSVTWKSKIQDNC